MKNLQSKQITNYYIFNSPIERVFSLLRDFKKTDSIFEDIRSPTKITKGINTYDIGNEFNYIVNSKKINFKVLEYQDESDTKKIKWNLQTDFMLYDYEYIFRRCTTDERTLLEWNILFKDKTPKDIEKSFKEQIQCMMKMERLLLKDLSDLYYKESTIIKCSRDIILSCILDLKGLSENNDFCLGNVSYSGDPDKEKSEIYFSFPFFAIEFKFVVEKAEFSESRYVWSYALKNIGPSSKDITALKEVVFLFIRIGQNKTYLEIRQNFSSIIDRIKMRVIADEIIKVLSYVKAECLNTSKSRERRERSFDQKTSG